MKYRILGKTGLKVSILSYGASALGSLYGQVVEKDGIATVRQAVELGINYFDCSPFYGDTVAETILGKALKEFPRDQFILSTKAGRHGWNEFDFSYQRIIQSAEESMRRLQVNYLDILNLHDIEYAEGRYYEQAMTEGIKALQKLKKDGKIGYYGITAYPLDILQQAIMSADIDTLVSHKLYTLNDTRLLNLLPLIQEKQVGLINSAPLASGLLTRSGVPNWHPADPKDIEVVQRAIQFCRHHGTNLEKLAIQFSTAHPDIPTTLVSATNPKQIQENVDYISQASDSKMVSSVQELLTPIMEKDWSDINKIERQPRAIVEISKKHKLPGEIKPKVKFQN